MKTIGFTTGVLYKKMNGTSKKAITLCGESGGNAIEISCIDIKELPKLKNINPDDLKSFKYISLHAPSGNFTYKNDTETKNILDKIEEACKKLNINYVIIHPDRVKNWKIFKNYSFKMAIENMDWRKETHKNVEEVKRAIKEANCKLVLDVNHCYTNDKTMQSAKDFYKSLKDKICEIHLSGFSEYHEPLFKTKQNEILEAVPGDLDVPIIIESICADENEMKKELDYINKFLT